MQHRAQPFHIQLVDLTLVQLANWRWSWRSTLLTGIVAPVLSTMALGMFADDDPEALAYILTGNMVMSLLFGNLDRVSTHFAYMRIVGRLAFFATLPITRAALILATVMAFLALSLPAVLVTLAVGALVLDVPLALSPWIVVAVPLIGVSLCGLGALIGIIVPTPEEVGNISTLATFLMMGAGPVVVTPDRLPAVLRLVGYFSPATYAASALRQTVLGWPDRIPLGVDLLALAAILVVSLWLVGQRMDWRQN